jgi:hypothetical protein
MPKPSILWVVSVFAVLTGCSGIAATVNARHEIAAPTASKSCPASDVEFDREPGGFIGPFAWRGRLSEDALAARAAREAAEQSVAVPCPVPYVRQSREPRRTYQAGTPGSAVEQQTPQFGGGVSVPNYAAGQTVYSPHECIGAVVMGQCHGSILPDYSAPHPTCYGQMLNGICTGPMF